MNRLQLTTLSMVFVLGVGGCSKPDTQSRAAGELVSTKQAADEAACDVRSGNAKDICMEEAKGRANIAKAELALTGNPSEQSRYALLLAKADAAYAVSKERCDDLSGNPADVCRKQAEQAFATAKADAVLAAKIADANSAERDANAEAAATARDETNTARDEAGDVKRDADYALAREKCDAFAGETKTDCLGRATAAYAQH